MREVILAIAFLVGFLSSFTHADDSTPIDILIAISKSKDKPKVVEPAKAPQLQLAPVYTWRVKRVPTPAGYTEFNFEGINNPSREFAYRHLMQTHGYVLKNITTHCDLSTMSLRDIHALHSSIHSGTHYGRWIKSKGPSVELIIFQFELP